MTFQFQYPWVLFLLWLVPLIGIAWHIVTRRRQQGYALVSPRMAEKLAPSPSPIRHLWQLSLLMAGLLLALVALARPQWGIKDETVYQKGRDLMIVLDVSRSMLAADVHPSRLGRAKVDLQDLLRQLKGDRVGLLAFRGKPLLLCPLTTDYGFLSQTLDGADVDSAPAGETDIGDAITEALNNFQGDEGSHKAIVLVSDGDDLAGKIPDAISKAKAAGVAIFTVGFGSTEGSTIPSALNKKEIMTFQGERVVSKLNHEVLRDLAEQTGGAYVPVGQANVKLGDLYRNHLSRITARDLEESVQRRTVERYQWFLLPAILCCIILAFFSRGQIVLKAQLKTIRPVSKTASAVLLAGLMYGLWSSPVLGAVTNTPAGREGARVAQKLYLLGRYDDAAQAYHTAAQTAASANRDDYLYNAGCAFLKAGKPEQAAEAFRSLSGTEGTLAANAAYNLGCALFASGMTPAPQPTPETPANSAPGEKQVEYLKEAGKAFQDALRQNPDDANSRKNLAVVAGLSVKAEEQARISRLMAEHGQDQPGALADMMLQQERKLLQDIPHAFTNTTPRLIDVLESLALDQDNTADLMIPLKGKLLQAMSATPTGGSNTNAQQQIAMVQAFAESIRDTMSNTAAALRDLDRSALPSAVKAEASTYTLWKGFAGYEALLHEDLRRQSNAISLTAPNIKDPTEELRHTVSNQQQEASSLSSLFKTRFEQTVPPEGIHRPVPQGTTNTATASTNATEEILSAKDRTTILKLTDDAIVAQSSATASLATNLAGSLSWQRKAHEILKEIQKLLPKEKQNQPQQNEQKQDQQKQQDQQQKQQPQDQQKQQPKPEPQKQEPKKGELSQDDLKKLLDKARQREQEHEQEKRERDTTFPMSPAERDW